MEMLERLFSYLRRRGRGAAYDSDYDAIIIGAGMGGLATAVLLARRGHRVAVLEKNGLVGGYASRIQHDGVAFDIGSQDIALLGKEGKKIIRELAIEKVLRSVSPHATSIYPEHRFIWDSGSAEGTKAYFAAQFPDQSGALHRFWSEMEAIYKELDRYLSIKNLQPSRPFPMLARYHGHTAEQFLRNFFTDETLVSLLSSYCLFYQGLPVQSLSALHFVGMLQSYFDSGAFFAEGGVGIMSEMMRAHIEKLGGVVELRAPVSNIEIENGRVKGVKLENGRTISSPVVIANVDPRVVYSRLLAADESTVPLVTDIRSNHLSRCQLHLLVEENAHTLPFVTFYTSTYDKAEEYEAFVRGEPIAMRMYCPPAIPRTMSIAVPAPFDLWQKAKEGGSAEYEQRKQQLIDRLLLMLKAAYPELTKQVRVMGMLTPVDLENWSGNGGGSLYGADATIDQSGLRKEAIASKIPGLFFAGQWIVGGSATLVLRGARLSADAAHHYLKRAA